MANRGDADLVSWAGSAPWAASDAPRNFRRGECRYPLRHRRDDFVRAHHLVVLVLEQMAMPDVTVGEALEARDDPCDHSGIGADGVLPAGFVRIGRRGGSEIADRSMLLIVEHVERAAVENLKANQMQMDGMRVLGEVDEVPDFH